VGVNIPVVENFSTIWLISIQPQLY